MIKLARAVLVVLMPVSTVHAASPVEPESTALAGREMIEEGLDEFRRACQAAAKAANYEEFAPLIPPAFKQTVETYKQTWGRHCREKAGTTVSIGPLADALDGLLADFAEINEDAYRSRLWRTGQEAWLSRREPEDDERYERFDKMVCQRFPEFIPAFKCRPAHIGASFFDKPSHHALGRIAQVRGDDEDQRFWLHYIALTGYPDERDMPWEEIWSEIHGSCIRFGEFDWLGAFRSLSAIKQGITRASYRAKARAIEQDMLNALRIGDPPVRPEDHSQRSGICACGPKDDVIATYRQVGAGLASIPEYGALARRMHDVRHAVESGQLPVINTYEVNCRGG